MVTGRRLRLLLCLGSLILLAGLADVAAGQLAATPTDEWIKRLEGEKRVAGMKLDEIMSMLEVKPGEVIADIGAGPGVLSLPLAKAVAPKGKVYAEDVDKPFLDRINEKLKEQKITNVQTVLGKFTDPSLPARDVDLALFYDVLHHIDNRAAFLKVTAAYLKPTGRLAVVDMVGETGSHKDKPEAQVTRKELDAWMAEAGFKPVNQIDGLFGGNQWFAMYVRK